MKYVEDVVSFIEYAAGSRNENDKTATTNHRCLASVIGFVYCIYNEMLSNPIIFNWITSSR